jgi:hypothetical protein
MPFVVFPGGRIQNFCLGRQTLTKRQRGFVSHEKKKERSNFNRFYSSVFEISRAYKMAGPTVYHGVAQKVYLVKEAVIGMSLGLVAGAVWKYSHWERRKEIQSYYDKKSSK